MKRWLGPLAAVVGLVAFSGLAVTAFQGARNRGRMTHCRNNLRYLGERAVEVLREARLNGGPDLERIEKGAGKEFWRLVYDVKLKGKKLDLSPFACPFVAGDMPQLGEKFKITYRGPTVNPYEREETILAADSPGQHRGRPIHVLIVKLKVKKDRRRREEVSGEFFVREAAPGDPLFEAAERETR